MQGIECYQSVENRDELTAFVKAHSPFIKRIAQHVKCRAPAGIELDDLIQAGLLGLLDAREKFSPEAGASFITYAGIKIRGFIIDELRKSTGLTRDIAQNIKHISAARSELENSKSHTGTISGKEMAEKMGVSEKRYVNMTAEINVYTSLTAHGGDDIELVDAPVSTNPMNILEKENHRSVIKQLLASLPKREQQILALYYNQLLTFKDIADILDLTEARISQLHAIALEKIKKKYQIIFDE